MVTVLVLLALGAILPYVSLGYLDAESKPVTGSPRLFGAAGLLAGILVWIGSRRARGRIDTYGSF